VIDVRLLARRAFGSASAVMFLATTVMFGTMSLIPLYYQQVRGESALHTGLLMIPFGVGMGMSLIIGSQLVQRTGARRLAVVGLLALIVGNLLLTGLDAGTAYPMIGAVQVIGGLGVGTVLVPVMTASLVGLRGAELPRGSTAIRVFQQLGGSMGGAVLLVVLQHRITVGAVAHGGRPDAGVLGHAFGATFWWPAAIGAITLVAALFLPSATPAQEGPQGSPGSPGSGDGALVVGS
jgi:MFS family permease